MTTTTLTATKLRAILIACLVIIAVACVGVFSFASTKLKVAAIDTSRAVIDADASQNNLQALQTIQKELAARQSTVERTDRIVADSQSYGYQNQIIADLNNYASTARVGITNIDFGSASSSTPATPAAPGATAPSTVANVKTTSVTVTLENPIPYTDLLTFMRLIEQNLTKMQIAKINISSSGESNKVTSDTLVIEVYIK